MDAWTLEGGDRLSAWSSESEPTVVLVIDPRHGFTCATQLAEWLEWRRENTSQFRFVYSRHPDDAERKALRMVRLPVDGVLRAPPRTPLPAELVFRAGELVYADSALEGRHSPLLIRLRSERLSDVLASTADHRHALDPFPTPPSILEH